MSSERSCKAVYGTLTETLYQFHSQVFPLSGENAWLQTLFRRRWCIFHFPTRKSKSLVDELAEALMTRFPLAAKSNCGIGTVAVAPLRQLLKIKLVKNLPNQATVGSFLSFVFR